MKKFAPVDVVIVVRKKLIQQLEQIRDEAAAFDAYFVEACRQQGVSPEQAKLDSIAEMVRGIIHDIKFGEEDEEQ